MTKYSTKAGYESSQNIFDKVYDGKFAVESEDFFLKILMHWKIEVT